MTDNKQHDTRTARRPDCVTEIRMGNSVLVVSGYFKKDTTTTLKDRSRSELVAEVREKLGTIVGANVEIGQPISQCFSCNS